MNLTATYTFSTPAFLGGADPRIVERLRPPSIKGALRFWWRALAWGRMVADAKDRNEADALSTLHREEARLFGSAAGDAGGGQGVFLLSVKQDRATPVLAHNIPFDPWLAYLAGPGLVARGRLSRDAIQGGFELECIFRRSRKGEDADADRHEIAKALWLLGTLGGLGSRARRGWGSLSLQCLLGDAKLPAPKDIAELKHMLAGMLGQRLSSCPPFSAFSVESRVDAWSNNSSDAMQILSMAGHELLRYRGYGLHRGGAHRINAYRDGQGNWVGEPARKNFQRDHDLGVAVYNETCQSGCPAPARAVFGLPHNMFFSNNTARFRVSGQPARSGTSSEHQTDDAEEPQRRASPLLMHVHSFPDGNAALIQIFLPAQFLPAGVHIAMRREERNTETLPYKAEGPTYPTDAHPDWNVVRDYLDAHDAVNKGLPHEFPDQQTIWPVPAGASTP